MINAFIFTYNFSDLDKWGKYDLEALFKQDLDYNAAFNVTSELIAMEIVNRIIVTFFEVNMFGE